MEQKINLNQKSLLDIPAGTRKILMFIETSEKEATEDRMQYFNNYFYMRLGGYEDCLRKNYILGLSVKFAVNDPVSRVVFLDKTKIQLGEYSKTAVWA